MTSDQKIDRILGFEPGRNIAERLRERAADHRENGWELMREGDPTLLEKAASEIERLRRIETAAKSVANTLNGGFIACPCGRQESTTDIDFAGDLYAALGITPNK